VFPRGGVGLCDKFWVRKTGVFSSPKNGGGINPGRGRKKARGNGPRGVFEGGWGKEEGNAEAAFAAAASIHGAWLVRQSEDSPHVGLDPVTAELYFAWCDEDPTAPTSDMPVLEDAMKAAGITYPSDFPTDPWEQLWGAVVAVFESWNNDRAQVYRELNDILQEAKLLAMSFDDGMGLPIVSPWQVNRTGRQSAEKLGEYGPPEALAERIAAIAAERIVA